VAKKSLVNLKLEEHDIAIYWMIVKPHGETNVVLHLFQHRVQHAAMLHHSHDCHFITLFRNIHNTRCWNSFWARLELLLLVFQQFLMKFKRWFCGFFEVSRFCVVLQLEMKKKCFYNFTSWAEKLIFNVDEIWSYQLYNIHYYEA
jgi:hypothetical protein